MRILPKSARETKEQFFGKRGWTLHTILIFTKNNDKMKLDVRTYDYWSTDTKQDACWLFLEPGKAKTTIDSHHASISHAIKRYVRIGYDIKGGQDIVEAGKNLAGTYFANIKPNRNENNENSGQMNNNTREKKKPKVKTISGISKYFYWEWPTEQGGHALYHNVDHLPIMIYVKFEALFQAINVLTIYVKLFYLIVSFINKLI
ncbi:hypothetical protein RhiirA5_440829 [Rhizophagus irregularis]|uniref:Uncharacterized protein n=1 Tax=Rhizophagus irregularis TaxID=588596 RepID=A0A2N0NGB0_9GLOM|nr:hypothetical protein RhiirA5_440829 [Rhizophagus irregularis]